MAYENGLELEKETPRILLVDDNHHVLRMISINIKLSLGPECEVIEADNGEEALNVLKKDGAFELVCTNLQMPLVDGIDVIQYVNMNFPRIPTILYSCCPFMDIEELVRKSGIQVAGIISLPANLDVITGTIDRVIKKAQPGKERFPDFTYVPFMGRDDLFTLVAGSGMSNAPALVRFSFEDCSCHLLLSREELVTQIKAALVFLENTMAIDFLYWNMDVQGSAVHMSVNEESRYFKQLTPTISPDLTCTVSVTEMTRQLKEALNDYDRDMVKWEL